MDLGNLFKKVPTLSAEEVRKRTAPGTVGDTILLDVREPREYEGGHLPGALHIPLSRLADRVGELDRGRPIVTY
jgi:rhodanese-related sulfurtransferase